jgi:outer membrane protein assembly factor BamB
MDVIQVFYMGADESLKTQFGNLNSWTGEQGLGGQLFQPTCVSRVTIASHGVHNVLIVATENDSVYALDADTGAVLWHTRTLKSSEVPSDSRNCGQVTPEIGITGTPVINMGTSPPTIYVHQKINRRRCGW